METAIQTIWWIGLAGALVLTLVILKQVALVLRTLKGIYSLGTYTRDAARGIERHVDAAPGIREAHAPAGELLDAAGKLADVAEALAQKLEARTGGARPGGV